MSRWGRTGPVEATGVAVKHGAADPELVAQGVTCVRTSQDCVSRPVVP